MSIVKGGHPNDGITTWPYPDQGPESKGHVVHTMNTKGVKAWGIVKEAKDD